MGAARLELAVEHLTRMMRGEQALDLPPETRVIGLMRPAHLASDRVVLLLEGPNLPAAAPYGPIPDIAVRIVDLPTREQILAWAGQFCMSRMGGLRREQAIRIADRATGLRVGEGEGA